MEHDHSNNFRADLSRILLWIMAVVVGMVAIYVISYFLLIRGIYQGIVGYPDYRFGGEISADIYRPIHRLDRRLRPGVWGPNIFDTRSQLEH